jgi:DAK2 domain fusion protein YloV
MLVWDGHALLGAFSAAHEWLTINRDRINKLNVFPVPDGDTGTNMALTMRSAIEEACRLNEADQAIASKVGSKIAYGALMGARGNSGVILSQIFRGFSRGIDALDEFDGRDLARSLSSARDMAYSAVMRPVEGTMLTVIRVAAERAELIAARTPSLPTVLVEALAGARDALADTPNQLELLRQAGVVDAGGQGLVTILEAMDAYARGELLSVDHLDQSGGIGGEMEFLDRIDELHGEDAFGYCTNFMIFGRGIDFPQVRADLAGMGQSAVIVGDDSIVKVHIHVLNPGKILDYALQYGELGQIKIDNMNAQTEILTEQREEARAGFPASGAGHDVGKQSVLAVASGEGLAKALRSMGATEIIRGGQTMNPSVEEILSAVERSANEEVILLPNNGNILMAANHVAELSAKRVGVVPTRSMPQGLAALASFNAEADLTINVTEMTEAIHGIRTVEITKAEKDASIDGVKAVRGQMIGLVDDHLVSAGDDLLPVALAAMDQAGAGAAELITVFTGEQAREDDTSTLLERLQAVYPNAEIEVYPGGQPHYQFVISVE